MHKKEETFFDENDSVEIFEENTIITLFDENDKPIEFYEIASIEHKKKFYELLQPVEPVDGIDEDEAVIFEYIVEGESEEKNFKPIFDEDLLNEVFSVYLRAIADYGDGVCGCGDPDCDGNCEIEDDDEGCDCSSCGDSSCAAHNAQNKKK